MNIIKDKNSKVSFIGISLSGLSTIESAVAVLNSDLKVITLDKLFSMNDVKYFIDNFPGKQNSVILVSIPENEIMISTKWKYCSRTYHPVNLNSHMINRDDWTNRFSSRGSDYFKMLSDKGVDIFRFDVDNIKMAFGNGFAFKERTPVDCKALQDTLRMKYNMRELPVNMLPVAQLEAILGAIFAHILTFTSGDFDLSQYFRQNSSLNDCKLSCKNLGSFEGLSIWGF